MLLAVCFSASAQDDDMYSFSSKKKNQQNTTVSVQNDARSTYDEDRNPNADYHTGQLRDVDEYNRRGAGQQAGTPTYEFRGDTLLVTTSPSQNEEASYDAGYDAGYYDGISAGDFCLTSRLARYRGL